MAEIKTKKTTANVLEFLKNIEDESKREDALKLLEIFKDVTKESPALWGNAMIGFGTYHYKSERSRQEGDWPLTAFSPRKQNFTVYIMPGFEGQKELLDKLGKHKVSAGSCLYFKRLDDINIEVLKELIAASFKYMKEKYKAT